MKKAELLKELGARIQWLRHVRGMTQASVGKAIGIGRASQCDIERGKLMPSIWQLAQYAALFRIPPHALMMAPSEWRVFRDTIRPTFEMCRRCGDMVLARSIAVFVHNKAPWPVCTSCYHELDNGEPLDIKPVVHKHELR